MASLSVFLVCHGPLWLSRRLLVGPRPFTWHTPPSDLDYDLRSLPISFDGWRWMGDLKAKIAESVNGHLFINGSASKRSRCLKASPGTPRPIPNEREEAQASFASASNIAIFPCPRSCPCTIVSIVTFCYPPFSPSILQLAHQHLSFTSLPIAWYMSKEISLFREHHQTTHETHCTSFQTSVLDFNRGCNGYTVFW